MSGDIAFDACDDGVDFVMINRCIYYNNGKVERKTTDQKIHMLHEMKLI